MGNSGEAALAIWGGTWVGCKETTFLRFLIARN